MSAQISTPISRGKVDSVTELPTTETLPTTTVSFLLPSALRCSLQSELLALVWPLQPASSAQLRLLPLCYICLNEPLSGEWGERGSEWESITEHRMGGRREREEQFPHSGGGEGERGRERERAIWVERVVAVLNVSTLINFSPSAYFFPITTGTE